MLKDIYYILYIYKDQEERVEERGKRDKPPLRQLSKKFKKTSESTQTAAYSNVAGIKI